MNPLVLSEQLFVTVCQSPICHNIKLKKKKRCWNLGVYPDFIGINLETHTVVSAVYT